MRNRKRFCITCHNAGITALFDTGNALKKHVRQHHPQAARQSEEEKKSVREYRRKIILARLAFKD